MKKEKKQRKLRVIPVIIFILTVILLVLLFILFTRLGGVNLTEMLDNAKSAFSRTTPVPIATGAPTPEFTEEPLLTPEPVKIPAPDLASSTDLSTPTDVGKTEDPVIPNEPIAQIPVVAERFSVQQGHQIPIFSYYSVSDGDSSVVVHSESVRPNNFAAQLTFLQGHGFHALTFEDLASLEGVEKPVMLTFDGGYADFYTSVFPQLKSHQIKATLFIWQGNIGKPGYLTESQVQEIAASGLVSVQAALNNYEETALYRRDDFTSMVAKSKEFVAQVSGRQPIAFAYPAGNVNSMELEVISSEFQFGVRRSGGRAYDTSKDETSLIYRYTMQRDTTQQLFEYWAGKAK